MANGVLCLPSSTPLAMRGTLSPWSAHPQVQRSAVRDEQTECRWVQLWHSTLKSSRGDISLSGRIWGILIAVWARGWIFLIFGTKLGTHPKFLSAKFQIHIRSGSFFMGGSISKSVYRYTRKLQNGIKPAKNFSERCLTPLFSHSRSR